jgi:hypothetical protein
MFAIAGPAYSQQPPDVVQTDGAFNTAMGTSALASNNGSQGNTAAGYCALCFNSTGYENTAFGLETLYFNTSGGYNIAVGSLALMRNTTGSSNTASGWAALYANKTGNGNTAAGANALTNNRTGDNNTASGSLALYYSTGGDENTASGFEALYSNQTGSNNAAVGAWGLFSNTDGHDNTACGQDALYSNTSGSYNVGLGENAGYYVTTGSNNIEIGTFGNAADSRTIRIGTPSVHVATYIAGIGDAKVTGSAIYVTSTGQLGVLASSERYKTAIATMGPTSEKLQQLRPVTFRLKKDRAGTVQYGLIAEEVARVYPELVVRDEAGNIEGVRYEELTPMLLNEVQKQQQKVAVQTAAIEDMQQELGELKEFKRAMQAALLDLRTRDGRAAQR